MPNLNNQVSGSAIAFIDTQVENYQSLIAGKTGYGSSRFGWEPRGDRPNY